MFSQKIEFLSSTYMANHKMATARFCVLSSFYNRLAGGKYGYMEVGLCR